MIMVMVIGAFRPTASLILAPPPATRPAVEAALSAAMSAVNLYSLYIYIIAEKENKDKGGRGCGRL